MTKPIATGLAVLVLILWKIGAATAGSAISPSEPMSCSNTVSTFPYEESFEISLGLWEQSSSDDFDWTRYTGPTPTTQTGPPGAIDGSYFLYTEADGHTSEKAILESPCFDLTAENEAFLLFKYNMYGTDIDTLKLQLSTDSGSTWPTELWMESGDQDVQWHTHNIDLSSYVGQTIKLRFYAKTGAGTKSDFAIDDIIFRNEALDQSLSCSNTVTSFPYQQSFENTLGNWSHVSYDDVNWAIESGRVPSGGGLSEPYTGPDGAADGTYYIYVEGSTPNYPDKDAILESPCFDLTSAAQASFAFKYNMNGVDMGTLRLDVFAEPTNTWTTVWAKTGDQGLGWYQENIDLAAYAGKIVKLRFYGITGANYTTDFCIDAVELTLTSVPSSPNCATLIQAFPYEESFESSWAGWTESYSSNVWQRNSGSTPSSNTGPTSAIDESNYLFTEASSSFNDTAYLNSPCFDLSLHTSAAFRFFYHMYGASMGALHLEVSTDNGNNWTSLWFKSGDQGNEWHWESVDLGNYVGQTIQLRFFAKIGSSWTSDMAVDGFYLDTDLSQTSGTLFGGAYFPSYSTCSADSLSGQAVENIYISIENHDDGSSGTYATDINGSYSGYVNGGEISLTANAYSTNWKNGVSTFDIIRYTKHIDDIEYIACPLFRLAADVNSDGEIDTLDKNLVNNLILNTISSFPDAPNWRLIPRSYMNGVNNSPDPVHAGDFWNLSKEDLDGNDYPFKAKLDFNQKSYTYDGSESWLQELDHWTYDSLVACQQGTFDFFIVKMGDVSGNASTSSFTSPPPPLREIPNSKDEVADQAFTILYPNKEEESRSLEKTGNKTFEIKIVASSETRIEGYQLGIQFDDEVLELGKIKPNNRDLKLTEAKNFGQARKTVRGGTLQTLWVNDFKNDPGGKAFGQNLELFSFEFKSKANLGQVRSAVRLDNGVWETAFYGKDGPLKDVDVQIFVEEVK